jgi:AraC-like DNA-binding protein
MLVKTELKKLGLHDVKVELGEVDIRENMSESQHECFKIALLKSGLELMDDKKSVQVEKIKLAIAEFEHYSGEPFAARFSAYLSGKLHHDYSYLSKLFSEVQGVSLKVFFVNHKIERVKQLLIFNGFSLTEVANQMNYSSVAHLSAQFKKITGVTASHFKQITDKR